MYPYIIIIIVNVILYTTVRTRVIIVRVAVPNNNSDDYARGFATAVFRRAR